MSSELVLHVGCSTNRYSSDIHAICDLDRIVKLSVVHVLISLSRRFIHISRWPLRGNPVALECPADPAFVYSIIWSYIELALLWSQLELACRTDPDHGRHCF